MSATKPDDAPTFDAARHLDAMASTLDLTITADQRAGVLQFLKTAEAMFRTVKAVPLEDNSFELAPAFRPGHVGGDA